MCNRHSCVYRIEQERQIQQKRTLRNFQVLAEQTKDLSITMETWEE